MENEKRIWDMGKKDVLKLFSKVWLIIVLIAGFFALAYFISSYYDSVVQKNYESKIRYNFIYTVEKTTQSGTSSELADPAMYIDLFTLPYKDKDIYLQVSRELAKAGDEDIHFSAAEIGRMLNINVQSSILELSILAKKPEYSQKVLQLLFEYTADDIDSLIKTTIANDTKGNLTITRLNEGEGIPLGVNYEAEESMMLRMVMVAGIVFVAIVVLLSVALVLIKNFDGKIRTREVFENNYQIPVLGEIEIEMQKEGNKI